MLTRPSLLGPFLHFSVNQLWKAQTKAEEAALSPSACLHSSKSSGSTPGRCPQLQWGCSSTSHCLFALKHQVKWFLWVLNLPLPLGKAVRCKMTWNPPRKNESVANCACTEKEAINPFQQAQLFTVVDYEGKAICLAVISDSLLGFALRLTYGHFKMLQLWQWK